METVDQVVLDEINQVMAEADLVAKDQAAGIVEMKVVEAAGDRFLCSWRIAIRRQP